MKPPKRIKLQITSSGVKLDDLQKELTKYCSGLSTPPQFEISMQKARFRSMEPAFLVAIVGASGAALGSLITGLLAIMKQHKAGKIEIHGKDYRKLIIPADMPLEKIDELLGKIEKMDSPRIHICNQ